MGGRPDCQTCTNKVAKTGILCKECLETCTNKRLLARDKTVRAEVSAAYKGYKKTSRSKPATKVKEAKYRKKVRDTRVSTGLCQTAGCPNPAADGFVRCKKHVNKHREDSRVIASTSTSTSGSSSESSSSSTTCFRRGCNKSPHMHYKICKKHYEEYIKNRGSYYKRWAGRESSRKLLALQREKQIQKKLNLGFMSLSIFEAFDLKKSFLYEQLQGVFLPDDDQVYMDTESDSHNLAGDIYEWSMLTWNDGKPTWAQAKSAEGVKVPEEILVKRAKSINKLVANKIVVQYGCAYPERVRMNDLLKRLPKDVKQSDHEHWEPQTAVLSKIFSREPKDEFKPDAKVYVPDFSLSYIARRLNRVYEGHSGKYEEYNTEWSWKGWATWRNLGISGKSVPDVVYLHSLVRVLRMLQAGESLGPSAEDPEDDEDIEQDEDGSETEASEMEDDE